MKKILLLLLKALFFSFILLILILCFVPLKSKTIAHLALLPIEKKLDKKIEFKSSNIWLPARVSMETVSIIEKGGVIYYFGAIDVYYNFLDLLFKREFFFSVKNAKLYRNTGLLDSVADILFISKIPEVKFDEIKGVLQFRKETVIIKHLSTHSDRVRISGNGFIFKDGSLDCDIFFSFSRKITDKVPNPIKLALLKDEGNGWMGIKLKASGNYKKPSLNITSDTLKINIMKDSP